MNTCPNCFVAWVYQDEDNSSIYRCPNCNFTGLLSDFPDEKNDDTDDLGDYNFNSYNEE